MNKHLVIFVKEPRIGRVKTRLARDIGPVAAWRFYRSMLNMIPQRLCAKGPWQTWIAMSPDAAPLRDFSLKSMRYLKQGGGDLGQRMLRPAQTLPKGAFVVVGTDVPGIKVDHIRKAFKALGNHDVVFGPAQDGGFWLVGHKRHPIMVDPYRKSVRWSHAETLNDCLKNLKRHKVGFVDRLSDVDNQADLLNLADKLYHPKV